MRTMIRAFLAATLALGAFGCGDDDDTADDDMFTPEDMGPEEDGFVPTPTVNVRIAHLIADAPAIRLCIGPPGATLAVAPSPSATMAPDGVPFRAVLPYITLPVGTYEGRVFAAETIDGTAAGDCTIDEEPLLTLSVDAADLEDGAYYTVAALGYVTPADYDCPTGAPTVTEPCGDDSAARLTLFEDSDVDADNALIRVLHGIANAPSVDVCYDPDTSAGDMVPVELFQNIAFGTDTEYNVQADDLTAGSFRIYGHNPAAPDVDCVEALAVAELPIPTPGAIQIGFADSPTPVVDDSYDTGSVHTVVAEGVLGVDPPADPDDPDNGFAAFVPLIDLPIAP